MLDQLERMEKRYQELDHQIAMPEIASNREQLQKLAQERASIENVVTKYKKYKKASKELEDVKSMHIVGLDEDMKASDRGPRCFPVLQEWWIL